ncbi:MAG: DUF1223 domain-containing protein [Steroidobacteraceae bacterium]
MISARYPAAVLLAALAISAAVGAADAQRFRSGFTQTTLVELYTSEGCSSCPPADRWLSSLVTREGLWRDFIPVAFHVDYWDELGWRDPFASRANSQRQSQHADAEGSSTVYTPGFVVNGREWRGWYAGERTVTGRRLPAGVLELAVQDQQVDVSFEPVTQSGPLQVEVVLLGFGLQSKVTAGENQGRSLRHDFIVLARSSASMVATGGTMTASVRRPRTAMLPTRQAMVAWVSRPGSAAPLQAAGGWLNQQTPGSGAAPHRPAGGEESRLISPRGVGTCVCPPAYRRRRRLQCRNRRNR